MGLHIFCCIAKKIIMKGWNSRNQIWCQLTLNERNQDPMNRVMSNHLLHDTVLNIHHCLLIFVVSFQMKDKLFEFDHFCLWYHARVLEILCQNLLPMSGEVEHLFIQDQYNLFIFGSTWEYSQDNSPRNYYTWTHAFSMYIKRNKSSRNEPWIHAFNFQDNIWRIFSLFFSFFFYFFLTLTDFP